MFRRQIFPLCHVAFAWTNADLFSITTLRTTISNISMKKHWFSFKSMQFKLSFVTCNVQDYGCLIMHLHSKVHGANMGPTWGRQDPGGPHVDPMNLAIWALYDATVCKTSRTDLVLELHTMMWAYTAFQLMIRFLRNGLRPLNWRGHIYDTCYCLSLWRCDPRLT